MRDIVTAKWSFRPHRLALGVVLIGMLLLTPQHCLGDDDATTTDSSQAQPAQQSPSGGPAPVEAESSKPASNNAVVRSNGQARGGPPSPPGECYECGGTDCLAETTNTVECHSDDGNPTRCITIRAYHHGPRDGKLRDRNKTDRFDRRKEWKGCHHSSSNSANLTTCAQQHLNFKLKDGKCFKGVYRISGASINHLSEFKDCAAFGSLPTYDPTFSQKPELAKGAYFEDFGTVEYADLWICMCKGNKCNTLTEKNLKDASTASASSLFKSFANGKMITFTLMVATASFLHLP